LVLIGQIATAVGGGLPGTPGRGASHVGRLGHKRSTDLRARAEKIQVGESYAPLV
jgi:hypothetical protein